VAERGCVDSRCFKVLEQEKKRKRGKVVVEGKARVHPISSTSKRRIKRRGEHGPAKEGEEDSWRN